MEDFQSYRPLLFSIAYRMTGSASEAEDLVQEAYLRYHAAPAADIRSLKSYLTTIVTRLCLDYLKSARVAREQYLGPWLPEPLLTSDSAIAALQTVEQHETIATAFMVLLERLTPQERAIFLLREVFDYGYDEIAEMIGLSAANCRQVFHRARAHIAAGRPRFEPSREAQRILTERFLLACQRGDMAALTDLLARDVVSWSDGGGKVSAARQPVYGREKAIRFIFGLLRKAPADLRVVGAEVNGGAGFLIFAGETLWFAGTFEFGAGQIQALHAVLNPDKLAYIRRQVAASGA
jgi:RNA polymerase sigma-70 factor, ECF subfamily